MIEKQETQNGIMTISRRGAISAAAIAVAACVLSRFAVPRFTSEDQGRCSDPQARVSRRNLLRNLVGLPNCEALVPNPDSYIRNTGEYDRVLDPPDGHITIEVDSSGNQFYNIQPHDESTKDDPRYSLQNSLDWIARDRKREGSGIDKVVLQEGTYYPNGKPLVLDTRHSGIQIEGQGKVILDAEGKCRCMYVDGEGRSYLDECVDIQIENVRFTNGHAGARAKKVNIARTDKRYTVWNVVDGGGIVVHGKAQVNIDKCTFQNCKGLICGGALSFDTAFEMTRQSRITNCMFEDCDLEPSGLGTGFAIDILSGYVMIDSCRFVRCGVIDDRTDNGIIFVFPQSFTVIRNCEFDMRGGVKVAVGYARGNHDRGTLFVDGGNVIILPDETGVNEVKLEDVFRSIGQTGPQGDEIKNLSEFGFTWNPDEGDYARAIGDLNPGVDGGGSSFLGKRDYIPKCMHTWGDIYLYTLGEALKGNLFQSLFNYGQYKPEKDRMTIYIKKPPFVFQNQN
ncbi:right-handed parallel beta-helix repeat-containing protein [Candidatus Dojkabacteria bacterium]|nr:right-handed parallel beta-helix repeat-containing protein [Candidatus Dojkabacteria bacterium]